MSEPFGGPVIGMSFQTMEEVEEYYKDFGREHVFAIARYYNYVTRKKGETTLRIWVCTRGRKPPRPQHSSQRCDCKARLKASVDKETGCWIVRDFNNVHNHAMVPISNQHFIPQNRFLPPERLQEAVRLRSAGIGVSKIYTYYSTISGGVENVGFTIRDLYNGLARDGKVIRQGGDADATIDSMKAQQIRDPSFVFNYKCDDDMSLAHILWMDGQSRRDYACFGDILIVDATYRTNAYGKPLVILAGVSNHHITIPFAFALLHDETISAYEWIFKQFLENMSNRAPLSVMTDGDRAMARAIANVFGSEVTHRLCGWHIMENGNNNVGPREFLKDLAKCVYGEMTIDEFESEWKRIKDKYDLSTNEWAEDLYKRRSMWANAFLRGSFFGQVRTTQRVEGMNARVKLGSHGSMRICELVSYLHLLVQKTRSLQAQEQYNCDVRGQAPPLLNRRLYKNAQLFYTRASMLVISKQLKLTGDLVMVSQVQEEGSYVLREHESGTEWQVTYTKDSGDFFCYCRFLQTVGFPCRHIFFVMKHEGIDELPAGLIRKRWTKFAMDIQDETAPVGEKPTSVETRYFRMHNAVDGAFVEAEADDHTSEWITNIIVDACQQR